ncbi:hypothetical protein [uncultured Desulfovibrio sp.]|uniref:hypothetical protein n=1 Tax=uncultured Desulfovibrio sp. TaxID=167968 RepID=UPI002613E1A2|nr:hypothetical protein [uncultured Desulfovibrio sp.]
MKFDPRVILTMGQSPEAYAAGMVEIFRAGMNEGMSRHEIFQHIRDIIIKIQATKYDRRLELEVKNCVTPCEFIITTYFLIFNMAYGTLEQYKDGQRILEKVKAIAPDFVGEKECLAFAYKPL